LTDRGQSVILDSDVAALYGVETRDVNQSIKNNPAKFPQGYIIDVSQEEHESLRSKFLILENQGRGKHVKYLPNAANGGSLFFLYLQLI